MPRKKKPGWQPRVSNREKLFRERDGTWFIGGRNSSSAPEDLTHEEKIAWHTERADIGKKLETKKIRGRQSHKRCLKRKRIAERALVLETRRLDREQERSREKVAC